MSNVIENKLQEPYNGPIGHDGHNGQYIYPDLQNNQIKKTDYDESYSQLPQASFIPFPVFYIIFPYSFEECVYAYPKDYDDDDEEAIENAINEDEQNLAYQQYLIERDLSDEVQYDIAVKAFDERYSLEESLLAEQAASEKVLLAEQASVEEALLAEQASVEQSSNEDDKEIILNLDGKNTFQLIDPNSLLSREDSFRMIDPYCLNSIIDLVKQKRFLYGPLKDPTIHINEKSKQLFGLIYYICHGLTKLPQEHIPPNFILCFDSKEEVFYFDYYFDKKRGIKHRGPVNEHNPERTRKYIKDNLIDQYFEKIVETIKLLNYEQENCEYSDPKYIKQLIDSRAEAYELLLVHKLIQFDKRIDISKISLDDFKQQVWQSFNENIDDIDPFLKIILIAMARLCDLQKKGLIGPTLV